MNHLWLTAYSDIIESLRARWFMVYSMVFGGIVVILFAFGLSESRIMGFTGLSRLLVTYIQLSMAILPIFVLITTVRSVAGDREAGIFEYMLSLPVSLAAWFWGRFFGRFIVVFLPVFVAMLGAVIWGVMMGSEIPWDLFIFYTGLLMALAWVRMRAPDVALAEAALGAGLTGPLFLSALRRMNRPRKGERRLDSDETR